MVRIESEEPRADIEAALLDAIHHFFEERATRPDAKADPERVTGRSVQLAATVLFLQMIAADQEAKHDEHRTLVDAVGRVLGVSGDDASTIIRVAETHVKTPLPKILRLLQNDCTIAQRKAIVECLWALAFSDAELAGHEEYFARKVAEAIGLNNADLVETKIRAREAFLER
jgi:uncharacterized tellurite resistance protein B-like protein